MSGKKADANADVAVDDLRDDIAQTREHLGETAGALADKADVTGRMGETARRHPVGLGTIVAGVLAAVAAIGALRWRRSRQTPKSRAKRLWRDAKGRARDVRKEAEGRARDITKDAKGRARKMKDRLS